MRAMLSDGLQTPGLTKAHSARAGLPAAALAARDSAAFVRRRAGNWRRGSGDPTIAALTQQLARRTGATASCRRETQKTKTFIGRSQSRPISCEKPQQVVLY